MAEGNDSSDDSQKTEEPTARKLDEARKRGQVVQSREITSWAMLFTATVIIVMMGPRIMQNLSDVFVRLLSTAHDIPTDPMGMEMAVGDLMIAVLAQLALPFLAFIVVAILANLMQTGPLLTTEPMKPSLSKISILKGIERLFSMKSLVEFIKGIAKMIVVGVAAYMAMAPYFDGVEHFSGQEVSHALEDMEHLFIKMMIAALIVLFIIAALDYLFQRYSFMQSMKMSKQEMKEEFKQTEGDPLVKGKLRQLREQRARQRMMQAVPEADVVITNPTHYAVALKYDSANMSAPVMVAKGADLIALKIKEIAKENKVTIVENAPLARSLFESMEIDDVIPADYYKAVAEVISYVFRLKGKKA